MGVGSPEILPDTVVELNHDITPARPERLPHATRHLARHVEARDACSICYAGLIHALYRMEQRGELGGLKGKIHIGQGFRGEQGRGVGFGECARGFDTSIPGCPPGGLWSLKE
jgi:hypothetical protein